MLGLNLRDGLPPELLDLVRVRVRDTVRLRGRMRIGDRERVSVRVRITDRVWERVREG